MADDIVSRVKQRYRGLAPYDFRVLDNRSAGVSDGRKLEFYHPEERDNPFPGQAIVEVFDPSFQGPVLEDMIVADFLHYLGKQNPTISAIRDRFAKSLTAEQKDTDMTAYQGALAGRHGQKETRPYDEWMDIHRLDQYLGSMFLPQGSSNRQEWMGGMTPEQLQMLDQIRSYLETGVDSTAGGDG